jgi:hypothetical protein
MSTAAVFSDIEKAFDTTWQPGLLYRLSKLQFSNNLIKLKPTIWIYKASITRMVRAALGQS